jgi:N-methylhydantoinase B/oxoprolinase/acetone carboxylase alpha subunit
MVKYLFDYKTEVRSKHQDLKAQIAAGKDYQERLKEKISAYKESTNRLESSLEHEKEQRASALRSVELLSG